MSLSKHGAYGILGTTIECFETNVMLYIDYSYNSHIYIGLHKISVSQSFSK